MLGRELLLDKPPARIVSLVPSQTELLYELGLKNRIAGQTVFCIHPASEFKTAVKVGGTKKLRFEQIDALKPDLIICNKEENNKADVDALSEQYPVWVSDISNPEDACQMIGMLGQLLDVPAAADALSNAIREDLKSIRIRRRFDCLYLIWRNPYMMAGKDTFIDSMLALAGFNNICPSGRYPETDSAVLKALNPKVLLLSSEPYPFAEKHIEELQEILPEARILLVDGEMFSWYGSRLLNSRAYFNELQNQLHRDIR